MTSLSRLSLTVLFATGVAVGCGDDEAGPPSTMVDAGTEGSSASSSSAVDLTSVNPGTPTDVTSAPDQVTTGVQTDATDEQSTTVVDAGDDTLSGSEPDGSVTDTSETTDVISTGGEETTTEAACGAQGELCCNAGGLGGTCDEGLVCNNPPGGGLSNSECVVPAPVGDGGDVTLPACGAQGELCCSSGGFGGTCDEGLECNNPAGGGLSNSECVVPAPVGDGGDVTLPACGAQGELCCASGLGGTCDEGLVCDNPAGGGLSNSECVAATPAEDAGDGTSGETCGAEGAACCAADGGQGTCDDGLSCSDPLGGGLTDSECIADAPEADASASDDAATP